MRLPHSFPGSLRGEKDDALALVQHQTLDEHQSNESLAETHAVAKEGTAVSPGDLHERPIRLLLVAIQLVEHLRSGLVPLGRGELVTPEELLQGLGVDIEGRIEARVACNRLDDGIVDLAGELPVRLEPLLKRRDLASTLDLDVQLDVLGQAGPGEVAGADQRLSTHDLQLGVRDVGLGVELVAVIDATLDLTRAEGFKDGGNAMQERIRLLVLLETSVESFERLPTDRFQESLPGPVGRLSPHEDADSVETLPLSIQGEKGTDLEVPGGDVERLGDAGPFLQVPESGPSRNAVVDDEEAAATGASAHRAFTAADAGPLATT